MPTTALTVQWLQCLSSQKSNGSGVGYAGDVAVWWPVPHPATRTGGKVAHQTCNIPQRIKCRPQDYGASLAARCIGDVGRGWSAAHRITASPAHKWHDSLVEWQHPVWLAQTSWSSIPAARLSRLVEVGSNVAHKSSDSDHGECGNSSCGEWHCGLGKSSGSDHSRESGDASCCECGDYSHAGKSGNTAAPGNFIGTVVPGSSGKHDRSVFHAASVQWQPAEGCHPRLELGGFRP